MQQAIVIAIMIILWFACWIVYRCVKFHKEINTEPPADPEDEEFFSLEETTYIDSAMNTWYYLQDVDTMLMSKEDAKRINRMRRQSLRIAAHFTNEIHTELFPTKEEDEG